MTNTRRWLTTAAAALLAACGGGGGGNGTTPSTPMTQPDAHRLAQQATFGPTEALLETMSRQSAAQWVAGQMGLNTSRYRSGGDDGIHRTTSQIAYCDQPAHAGPTCWRDAYSHEPLVWDFYRNAMTQPDQLRQRVAFALGQIVVVSANTVKSTYGLRRHHGMLLSQAFGNWREVLRQVSLSPVMGDYLNNVNNDKASPNENYARELLQLFSVGPCLLDPDGRQSGGRCQPTYDNQTVREYAHALTGWTYPPGGASPWGCWPEGTNCRHHGADMVPVPALHDDQPRQLLSGRRLAAGHGAAAALETVLDSLMAHPNMAPFIGRQLIQHLVSSNPTPAYVERVARAFSSGRHGADGLSFGTGQPGDLAATVAAVLLDAEARGAPRQEGGRLREPVLMFTGVLRGLNGVTDGEPFGWWIGEALNQQVFRPPSVFSFYPPDYPVPGTSLVGPAFGIHNANTALNRLNVLTWLLHWGGSPASSSVPGATGTRVNLSGFVAGAGDAPALVDRLAVLATGAPLPTATRQRVLSAVEGFTAQTAGADWQMLRVQVAAYLVYASPAYHVIR
jgi:uncharacterized protein (DUF1800 family)